MKLRRHWPIYLLLTTIAVLGVHLAWTLTVSETGWQAHLDQWVDAAAGLVGSQRLKLGDQPPEQQARFWLAAVEQIDSATIDQRVAMGAAWMLDAPEFGFIRRHVRMRDDLNLPGVPVSWRRELDHETIAALIEDFELLCRDECLDRIELAVRLDSGSVEVQRARALPDNALYDYLAALHLWNCSTDYEWEEAGCRLTIQDEELFKRCNDRFAAGLAKPNLQFGTHGYAATFAFLDKSSVSRPDQLAAAGSRQIDARASSLLYGILRWRQVEIDVEKQAGRLSAAVTAVRSVLALCDQLSETGNHPAIVTPRLVLRKWGLANLRKAHESSPALVTAEEAAEVATQLAEGRVDLKVVDEAGRRMAGKSDGRIDNGRPSAASFALFLLAAFALVAAQSLVIMTVGLGLCAALAACLLGKSADEGRLTMGVRGHLAAWLSAIAISSVLLGMLPAGVVPASIQTQLFRGLLLVGYSGCVVGVLVRRRFGLPWSEVVSLATVTAVPLIAPFLLVAVLEPFLVATAEARPVLSRVFLVILIAFGWALFHVARRFAANEAISRRRKALAVGVALLTSLIAVPAGAALGMLTDALETRNWIPPTVWPEAEGLSITADELQSAMKLEDSRWVWALILWHAHRGAAIAPLLAVGVLLILHVVHRARHVDAGFRQIIRSRKRHEIGAAARSVAVSCVMASLVFFLLYLGQAATVAHTNDRYYRVRYDRMANSSQGWAEIAAAMEDVRANTRLMQRFKAEIRDSDARERSKAPGTDQPW